MKTISLSLTENEAKALVSWINWTKEERTDIASRHAENCRIGRYIDNSKPNAMHDENILVLNLIAIIKQKLI